MRPELEKAVRLLRNGDEESLQQALALLQRTVLSFGIKLCGHREDAEDTAQEVLVNSLPHLAKLDNPSSLSAWLYTAARNRCWQDRRRATYRKAVALEDLMPNDGELQSLLLADAGQSPESQASSRQDHALLHQAILSLPPQYRIVLVLHDMEELGTEQVARILFIQPGTVRVRLHRARLQVRQEMGRLLNAGVKTGKTQRKKSSRKRPVQCREIFANLSEYLDGRLPVEDCEQMRRHIEGCPACVAFIQDLKRAIDRCRALDVCPDQATRPILSRLLTEEYLRLKKSSANL